MRLHPSLGRERQGGGDPEDVAYSGVMNIFCMVGCHAPNKQLFLEAGAEEVLRDILANKEISNSAKSYAPGALNQLGLQVDEDYLP